MVIKNVAMFDKTSLILFSISFLVMRHIWILFVFRVFRQYFVCKEIIFFKGYENVLQDVDLQTTWVDIPDSWIEGHTKQRKQTKSTMLNAKQTSSTNGKKINESYQVPGASKHFLPACNTRLLSSEEEVRSGNSKHEKRYSWLLRYQMLCLPGLAKLFQWHL